MKKKQHAGLLDLDVDDLADHEGSSATMRPPHERNGPMVW